jgi:hypothetical protein
MLKFLHFQVEFILLNFLWEPNSNNFNQKALKTILLPVKTLKFQILVLSKTENMPKICDHVRKASEIVNSP